MQDGIRSEIEARLSEIEDDMQRPPELLDAIAACCEVRYLLGRLKRGLSRDYIVDPNVYAYWWNAELESGLDCALASIKDILRNAWDVDQVRRQLAGPISIGRFTLS